MRHSKLFTSALAFIFYGISVNASAATAFPSDGVFRELLEDFYTEVRGFDQFQSDKGGPIPEVEEFLARWEKWRSGNRAGAAPVLKVGKKTWVFSPQQSLGGQGTKGPRLPEIQKQAIPESVHGLPSSMANPEQYVRSRIGEKTYELIRDGRVAPFVYGGTVESWKEKVLGLREVAYSLPSPYEEWGVRKFLVESPNQKPVVHFVVPPIYEYVLHHLALFDFARADSGRGWMNKVDRNVFRSKFTNAAEALPLRITKHFENAWVSVGYASALERHPSVRRVVDKIDTGAFQLTVLELDNGMKLITLGSPETLWGEGSSFLVESFLPFKPQGVLFMGSAGYLERDKSVYDFHAAKNYRDWKDGSVELRSANAKAAGVHLSIYSPLAETRENAENYLASGIKSVDVEQSLIARSIAEFNEKAGLKIRFNSINLITDLPSGGSSKGDHPFDLDRVDPLKKQSGKRKIVDYAVSFFKDEHKDRCRSLLFKAAP